MKSLLVFFLKIYKKVFSKALELMFGKACRFTPTCSEYAIEAIEKKGVIKGSYMATKRVLRCNPLTPSGYDPV